MMGGRERWAPDVGGLDESKEIVVEWKWKINNETS